MDLNSENSTLVGKFADNYNSTTPTEEYFNRKMLKISSGIDDVSNNYYVSKIISNLCVIHPQMGGMRWELVGCLFLAWLIVFTVLIKGVKSLGKAVWFTALFPYLILSILLCFGLSLDGAMDDIRYYVTPNLSRLWDIQVEWLTVGWLELLSLSTGLG